MFVETHTHRVILKLLVTVFTVKSCLVICCLTLRRFVPALGQQHLVEDTGCEVIKLF